MAIEELTVENEGESFIYCPPVADNEDDALMDFLQYLLQ